MFILDEILGLATALGAEDSGLIGQADSQTEGKASKKLSNNFDEASGMLANFVDKAIQFGASDSNSTSIRSNPHPSMYRRMNYG